MNSLKHLCISIKEEEASVIFQLKMTDVPKLERKVNL